MSGIHPGSMHPIANPGGVGDAADRLRAWVRRLEELGRTDEAQQVLKDAMNDPAGPLAIEQEQAAAEPTVDRGEASPIPPEPSDAELEAAAWATWLSGEERHDEARQAVAEALAAHGRSAFLLICAAEIESAARARHTALWLRREAYRLAPGDVGVVCDLAFSLATMLVVPQLAARVDDALRILDGFGDQNDPQIRTVRGLVLEYLDAPAARIAAAYGRVADLSETAARSARSCRRRSAGPLGRWWIGISDRIRGKRRARPYTEDIPRTEAESEAIARVLDSLDGLESSEAKARIEAAMEEYGRRPSLLLAYAKADQSAGSRWHALAMAGEAAYVSPDSLDAVCSLAWHSYARHGYGTALQVLAGLPPAARSTVDVRILAGRLHQYSGNFARAATVYGDPRGLPSHARKWRRQCIRKALLQPTLTLLGRGDIAAADLSTPIAPPPGIARVLDDQTTFAGDPVKLRELLQAAITQHGRHPRLLLTLAEVEVRYGDDHTGAALATEALPAAPEDPLIVGDVIETLWQADRDADALRMIRELSEPLRQSLYVRHVAARVLRYWQLWVHATAMYGRGGLTAAQWGIRQGCWLRRGGPLPLLRTRLAALEDDLLGDWPMSHRQATALPTLPLPDSVAAALRGELLSYNLGRKHGAILRHRRLDLWLTSMAGLISALALFAALTTGAFAYWPELGAAVDLAAAAGAAAVAEGAVHLFNKATGRMVTRLAVAVVCGAGAGILLTATERWAYSVGVELAAFAALVAIFAIVRPIARFCLERLTAPWYRTNAEYAVLNCVLDVLGDLRVRRERFDASTRRRVMARLESAATRAERDLPDALRTGDAMSQGAVAARARAAAHQLRETKLALAMPVGHSVQDAVDSLTQLAVALACHDFEHWPAPLPEPPATSAPRSRWQRATTIVRTVLVIFGPPLVAYFLPLVAPLTGPGLSWLRAGTIVWALIGAVVTLDPAFNERSRKMRDMLAFLRDAMSAAGPKDSGKDVARSESTGPSISQSADPAEGEGPRRGGIAI